MLNAFHGILPQKRLTSKQFVHGAQFQFRCLPFQQLWNRLQFRRHRNHRKELNIKIK